MQNISVSLKIVKRGQEAARLRTSFGPQVEAAVMKARARLLALQRPEGYWWEELEANSTLTSEYVFLMHMLDRVDEGRQAKCAAELLAEQLPDGGWGIGDGKGGQLSASIEAYAALKLVGCDLDSAPMARARQFILARGGLGQARMFTRIHFALLGWWSYDALPALPPWIMMLPERSPMSIYQMSSWARSCVVPLIILLDKKPVWRPRRNIDLAELIVRRDGTCTDTQDAASANGPGASSRNALFGVIDRVLRWLDRHDFVPLRRRSIRRAESWILERQDDEGDWGGILPAMMYSLLALRALGYAVDHPVLRRGRAAIDRFAIESGTRLRMQSCVSPVWDSALAIWSLREAGLPADHPALAGGAHWLLGKQVSRYGDWSVKNRGGKPGGWSFEFYNRYYPDCDDTAAVILALHGLDLGPDNAYRDASIENAREWVLSMQCRNGGWAAFDVDNTQQLWNRIPFADHGAMLDEASPDVTGHVLEILYAGAGDGARAAAGRALAYLRAAQRADGSWFGRWGVNFVYGTCAVLCGMRAAGVAPADAAMRGGAAFLKHAQNEDGGWGESCLSYDADAFVRAPSCASQTAWGVMGLLAAGEVDGCAVRQGIAWLLANQNDDGGWDEAAYTGTGFPGHFYLRYHLYRDCFPLLALARYRVEMECAFPGPEERMKELPQQDIENKRRAGCC